jgi:hypothetical protein
MGLIKQYSRISHHTLSQANTSTGDPEPFTVPLSEDFTDGSWTPRDLALSEIGVVEDEKRIFIRVDNEIREFLTGPVGGIVPGNSTDVIINLGGEFYADGGFQYDPTGDRQLNIFTGNSVMQMGLVQAGTFTFPGAGFTYDGVGDVYFQDGYIDPGYVVGGNDQKASGFFAGDLTTVGGLDYAWQAGYRDLATQEQSLVGGQPGQANIIVKDPTNLGIRVQVTDLLHETTIDKTAAQYNVLHPESKIQLGSALVGSIVLPRGAILVYEGSDPDKFSGFVTGDFSTLGQTDYQWGAGYTDFASDETSTVVGRPGELSIVVKDPTNLGVRVDITDLLHETILDQPAAQYNILHPYGRLQLGEFNYGTFIVPKGVALAYTDGSGTELTGFYAGDLTTLSGIDRSWTAGYRNTADATAYNIEGDPTRVIINAKDPIGAGTQTDITELEFTINLNNSGAVFRVKDAIGDNGLAVSDVGVVKISDAYELPDTSGTAGYQVITDGTNWVYSNQPRYINYFEFGVGTVTNIGTTNVWQKLNAVTTQGFTNNGLVHTNNRIENTGDIGIFKAEAIISAEMANNNQEIHLAFFKDDGTGFAIIPCSEQRIVATGGVSGRKFLIPIQCLVQLDTGDKLEVWIKNATSTSDATLDNLNMILNELK